MKLDLQGNYKNQKKSKRRNCLLWVADCATNPKSLSFSKENLTGEMTVKKLL